MIADAVYAEAQATVARQAAFHEGYAPLDTEHLTALGDRLAAPLRVVPPFLPSWARRCMGFGGGKGWADGWYIVVGGRTGMGKSVLAANAASAAVHASVTTALHSTEMEWDANAIRALAVITATETFRLQPGEHFSREHFARALHKLEEICESSGARLITNKRRKRNLRDVTDGIRSAWEIHGARFHVVDYLQLIATGTSGYYSEDVNARIAEVSDNVLGVTEDCGVVTAALSQMNREGLKSDRRPEPFMLHGGSALENDAYQVGLMDHTRQYEASDKDAGWNGWMILAKNRYGPAGVLCDIPIYVSRRTLRIRERMDDEVALGERIEPNKPKPKI